MAPSLPVVPSRDTRLASLMSDSLLGLPAAAYFTVQKLREQAFRFGLLGSARSPVPVISVGNILMGGTGKTPFTMYLAQLLTDRGLRPAVVSRGYRGSYLGELLVVSRGDGGDPEAGPSECGDEPFLIAKRMPQVPVIVARRRIQGARAAAALFKSDVVVLDDGFQHLRLQRDVDIVLMNGSEDRMFPLGRLREPISALRRADAVVLTGSEDRIPELCQRYVAGAAVFRCRQEVVGLTAGFSSPFISAHHLAGKDVILISAIAEPERFSASAKDLGWRVTRHFVYRDHHKLPDRELRRILQDEQESTIVVTEKDWVKLPAWFTGTGRVWAMRIGVNLENEEDFNKVLFAGISA
jgi:tetraacyldisaccharide 4'-kinase